jgi:hypothetical protein
MAMTWNPAGNAKVRLTAPKSEQAEKSTERVSLAPLDPETALRALLATPPVDRAADEDRQD